MKNIIIKNDAIDIAFHGSKIIFEQLRKKKKFGTMFSYRIIGYQTLL